MKAQRRCAASVDSCSTAGYDSKGEAGLKNDCNYSSGSGQPLRNAAAAAAATSRQALEQPAECQRQRDRFHNERKEIEDSEDEARRSSSQLQLDATKWPRDDGSRAAVLGGNHENVAIWQAQVG